jgi:hypothetical protein
LKLLKLQSKCLFFIKSELTEEITLLFGKCLSLVKIKLITYLFVVVFGIIELYDDLALLICLLYKINEPKFSFFCPFLFLYYFIFI